MQAFRDEMSAVSRKHRENVTRSSPQGSTEESGGPSGRAVVWRSVLFAIFGVLALVVGFRLIPPSVPTPSLPQVSLWVLSSEPGVTATGLHVTVTDHGDQSSIEVEGYTSTSSPAITLVLTGVPAQNAPSTYRNWSPLEFVGSPSLEQSLSIWQSGHTCAEGCTGHGYSLLTESSQGEFEGTIGIDGPTATAVQSQYVLVQTPTLAPTSAEGARPLGTGPIQVEADRSRYEHSLYYGVTFPSPTIDVVSDQVVPKDVAILDSSGAPTPNDVTEGWQWTGADAGFLVGQDVVSQQAHDDRLVGVGIAFGIAGGALIAATQAVVEGLGIRRRNAPP